MKLPAQNPLSVLIVGYEAAPFYKRGGLGDVMKSLPKALRDLDIDARVVMPYYKEVRKDFPQKRLGGIYVRFGKELRGITIHQGKFPQTNVPIYFLDGKKYIDLHNKGNDVEEFAFFDLAVSYFTTWLGMQNIWQPTIIHCNDWHTGLIPLLLKNKLQSRIPTLLTIHNLLYQGNGSMEVLDLLNIKDVETKDIKRGKPVTGLNLLGEGILHATRVSTVSPTYAQEITTGRSLGEIYTYLHRREQQKPPDGKVLGILNGIDYEEWDPRNDKLISPNFGMPNLSSGKAKNKQKLLKMFGFADRPTISFVGRMAGQKGLDLLAKKIDEILKLDVNIILLGTGQKEIENKMREIAKKYPSKFRAEIYYKEGFAHELYAGSDFLLVPSHYEPCGLIQMIAMRYGTIPIAAKTGGLADSIKQGKTGFLFEKNNAADLVRAIQEALKAYAKKDKYREMQHAAMKEDFSWDESAKRYKDLYIDILKNS